MASTKYTTTRAGSSRLRTSPVSVAATTSSTSSAGIVRVNTPIAIRSDNRTSVGGLTCPARGTRPR
jgi:hypothetical protein